MTFKDLALTRISNKFKGNPNFQTAIRFAVDIFDNTVADADIIKDTRNMDSIYPIVLDELGKLLGVYPRPYLDIGVQGTGYFQYSITEYGTAPYFGANDNDNIRQLNDEEYIRLIKATATLTTFNGTINDWVKFFTELSGGVAIIINRPSTYGVVIRKDLSQFEKNLVDFLSSRVDNLTVSRDFIGTTTGDAPFQYGVTPYGTASYIRPW